MLELGGASEYPVASARIPVEHDSVAAQRPTVSCTTVARHNSMVCLDSSLADTLTNADAEDGDNVLLVKSEHSSKVGVAVVQLRSVGDTLYIWKAVSSITLWVPVAGHRWAALRF